MLYENSVGLNCDNRFNALNLLSIYEGDGKDEVLESHKFGSPQKDASSMSTSSRFNPNLENGSRLGP